MITNFLETEVMASFKEMIFFLLFHPKTVAAMYCLLISVLLHIKIVKIIYLCQTLKFLYQRRKVLVIAFCVFLKYQILFDFYSLKLLASYDKVG